jgi:hypothetical protein
MHRFDEAYGAAGLRGGSVRRDLLLGTGAFALFALVSLSLLVVLNTPGARQSPARLARLASGEASIDVTLLHTNDTWGYLTACG